jgi:hypothetical protein
VRLIGAPELRFRQARQFHILSAANSIPRNAFAQEPDGESRVSKFKHETMV